VVSKLQYEKVSKHRFFSLTSANPVLKTCQRNLCATLSSYQSSFVLGYCDEITLLLASLMHPSQDLWLTALNMDDYQY
jgi:hypothetical protein